ncbi:putative zinc finger protein RTS2 [Rosellinia necatrix]|uniref:Putative zinc finger protein RTS2 n=1 Tax=Rosellinia necatrix TaxID=77044 RepID=A0A1W2THI8_ROSNE|nr:putative zinc finger protein RTS2 [Rosellinia necatrix]
MPKAEAGSVKDINKRMKMKGLQRLRFFCQVCERQMRDENGFKQHTMSESHVRQMLIVGEDPKKHVEDFSKRFLRDFIQLLRTSHGEKSININHFYQNYIANKEHVHMNATKWPSLTEFAKYLGRESICRVEETDKGLHVAWIDDSPDALRRKEAVRRKEMQDKGDEEREQRMIREQIRRAKKDAAGRDEDEDEEEDNEGNTTKGLTRQDGEKVKLSFGLKPAVQTNTSSQEPKITTQTSNPASGEDEIPQVEQTMEPTATSTSTGKTAPLSLKLAAKPQTKNVFATAKKNALTSGQKKTSVFEQPKKMSEAERIMREEQERKRSRQSSGLGLGGLSHKRQRT